MAFEIADALRAALDVFLVRKLGVPGQEELAFGAIASGGVRVTNEQLVKSLGIPREWVEAIDAREMRELERRERAYRGHHGRVVDRCRVVGGYEEPLALEAGCTVAFSNGSMLVASAWATYEWRYEQLHALRIGGPGDIHSGGRFFGGGTGVDSAIKGMVVASLLNAGTARVDTQTLLALGFDDCELVLLTSAMSPQSLEVHFGTGAQSASAQPPRARSCRARWGRAATQARRVARCRVAV